VSRCRGGDASGGRGDQDIRATDILWTLNHPDVWHLPVHVRGWTPEQWETWFAAAAQGQLLAPTRSRPAR
jgi:hypothetical protein